MSFDQLLVGKVMELTHSWIFALAATSSQQNGSDNGDAKSDDDETPFWFP